MQWSRNWRRHPLSWSASKLETGVRPAVDISPTKCFLDLLSAVRAPIPSVRLGFTSRKGSLAGPQLCPVFASHPTLPSVTKCCAPRLNLCEALSLAALRRNQSIISGILTRPLVLPLRAVDCSTWVEQGTKPRWSGNRCKLCKALPKSCGQSATNLVKNPPICANVRQRQNPPFQRVVLMAKNLQELSSLHLKLVRLPVPPRPHERIIH
jgi:hypothetical protein